MKHFYSLTMSCFLLLTISCQTQNIEETEIRRFLDDYSKALSSKSAKKIGNVFHEEAKMYPEGQPTVSGRAAIQAHFKGLETIDFNENFDIEEILPAGELTIVKTLNTGMWKNPTDNSSGSFSVKGQMVMKRNSEGALKLFRYIYNSNLSEEATGSQEIAGSFAHVVYFWLKEPNNQTVREQFVNSLTNFIDNSSYIKSKHLGTPANTKRQVIDSSYTYCLIVTFDSKEDHDKYQAEQGHLKFIEESSPLWKKVMVYDSESL